jgi:predicted permease
MSDFKYAFRSLAKSPGFTTVAVVTLALGIGANAAIFSVIHGVVLKPLGYHEPDRIVTVLHGGLRPVAPADFLDWRAEARTFERMAAAEAWGATLTGGDRAEALMGIRYGEGFFQLLGVQPLAGRAFGADDYQPGGGRVVVLGHALWQRRFGGDTGIVGRTITLNRERYTVVGVMPAGFQFTPFWFTKAEFAAPLDLSARASSRGGNSLRIFGRLKDQATLEQAQLEMDAICARLEREYPATNTGRTVRVVPLHTQVVGNVREGLIVLAGAVLFVLLIACANVANLLLARATRRQREIALRTALGASRWRVIRQLLAESVVLAGIGGALGLLVAYATVDVMKALLSGDSSSFRVRMPRVEEIAIDGPTLLFSFAVTLLTAVMFGLVPAIRAARPDLQSALKDSGRGTTDGRGGRRLRSALVVAEIALALVTLAGAGLMLRTFERLSAVDAGFDPRNVLSAGVSLQGQAHLAGEGREAFYRQLLDDVAALPGVTAVSAVNHLPLAGDVWNLIVSIEGRPLAKPGAGIRPAYRVAMPGYFRTMGIAITRGRDFTAGDRRESPGVAIINETFARRHWPGDDPLGKRVTTDDPRGAPKWFTIVGVIEDTKQASWTDAADPEIYFAFAQSGYRSNPATHYSGMTLVVRTAGHPSALANPIQSVVARLNPDAPVSSVTTLDDVIGNALWQPRFNLVLIGFFAVLAMTLACVGIYGVMAYTVTQRTQEIGVRIALGARTVDVSRLIIGQGMALAAAGIVLGLAGARAVTHLMATVLFEVAPTDPVTFASVPILLAGAALLACWLPARRAARLDPVTALRAE